jgi:G3E family GTPase
VVVNEFGEIALDAALIGHEDEHTIVLAGGCVCCIALGDFVAAVQALEARAGHALARVVIETSGLADPMPILQALTTAPDLAARYVPGSVIATIDALQGERELGRQHLAVRQVAIAERIVLTKSDIAAPRAVQRLRECLREINPTATLIVANHGDVTPGQLFDGSDVRAHPCADAAHLHHHGPVPRAFSRTWNEPLRWQDFGPALERLVLAHGESLLRMKGIVHVAGDAEPVVVQAVRGFLHDPIHLAAWPDSDRTSRLVFITDGLSEATLREALP